jgi:hypothetical protein
MLSDLEVIQEKDADNEVLGKDEITVSNLATLEQLAFLLTEFKHIKSVVLLFTCRINSPIANYRISIIAQRVPRVLKSKKRAKHKGKNIGIYFS